MENHVCLPLLSLFYQFIERTLIMGDQIQIQRFLKINISFWVIQIPERLDQSDRALMDFAHTDAVHSVPDGPAGTSAWLLGALRKEGGLGWI